MNNNDTNETAHDYVVEVFPGDHDKATCAAGFISEDGNELHRSIHDPDLIDAVAAKLTEIAAVIRANRRDNHVTDNIVSLTDWGRHGSELDA